CGQNCRSPSIRYPHFTQYEDTVDIRPLLSYPVVSGLPLSPPSPPLALEHEPRPVEGRTPALLRQHLDLRGAQRGRRTQVLLEELPVEADHQLGRRLVVGRPEAADDAR